MVITVMKYVSLKGGLMFSDTLYGLSFISRRHATAECAYVVLLCIGFCVDVVLCNREVSRLFEVWKLGVV